ncbi:hypothetical protein ACUXK4_003402 [Methylorubrum extorquens]
MSGYNPPKLGKRLDGNTMIMTDRLQSLVPSFSGDVSDSTLKIPIVPSRQPLNDFPNAPNFSTPDTFDTSNKGATTAYVHNFFKQRQGNTVSPFDYCTGPCGKGQSNDTVAVQAALSAMVEMQANGVQSPSLDLRGGMFAVNAPLTMRGTPHGMNFGNGSIIPFTGYTGDFFDFSGTVSTTKLRFIGISLNGYGTARHLLRLGRKTQGTVVMHSTFFNWKGVAILDPTTAAATENQISSNVFEGGRSINQGTAIEIYGNDSEINDNIIYNVATGIRTHAASHTISRNHIYSVDVNQPIPLIDADTGDQMQIVANYLDQGYVRFRNPSGLQYLANRVLTSTTLPADQFNPIVLQPTAADARWFNILILGNQFRSLFPAPNHGSSPIYSPVKLDISAGGSASTFYNVHMKDNGFYGFLEQTTEPSGSVSGTDISSFGINLAAKLPFGTLAAVESVTCSFGTASINNIGIGLGDPFNKIVYVGTASNQSGSCRAKATINLN